MKGRTFALMALALAACSDQAAFAPAAPFGAPAALQIESGSSFRRR